MQGVSNCLVRDRVGPTWSVAATGGDLSLYLAPFPVRVLRGIHVSP